jgi:hypothetical protein
MIDGLGIDDYLALIGQQAEVLKGSAVEELGAKAMRTCYEILVDLEIEMGE